MLTWTCHICDEERPDAQISVFKRTYPIADAPGATMQENIRYCNDRESCAKAAETYTFLGSADG